MEETNIYTFRLLSLCLGIIFITDRLASRLGHQFRDDTSTLVDLAITSSALFATALTMLTSLALAFMPISERHSFLSALNHFFNLIFLFFVCLYREYTLEKAMKQPVESQNQLLLRLMAKNKNTEFGKKMEFNKVENRGLFREKVKITTYDDYRTYVERMEKGENGFLSSDPLVRFNLSSGTTGKCKLLPSYSSSEWHMQWHFYLPLCCLLMKLKNSAFLAPLKEAMFMLVPRWRHTDNGIPIGPASATLKKSTLEELTKALPLEMEFYADAPTQLYLRWLFALSDRQICRFDAAFAGNLVSAVQFLEKNWQQLADDIRHGRVSKVYQIDENVVEKVERLQLLAKNPSRADEIENECATSFEGIVKRLWPRIISCCAITTGSHRVHRRKLQFYLGERIRIYSAINAASEAIIGINMEGPSTTDGTDEPQYTLMPDATFFEFIPEDEIHDKQPETTLFLDQVEVGKRYEIVATSEFGFYRYRLGDVIEITSFRHGKTPVFKFIGRLSSVLDLIGEKTTESMVHDALEKSVKKWKRCKGMVDYTTSESCTISNVFPNQSDSSTSNGMFYVIFVELEKITNELAMKDQQIFDEQLQSISYPYKSFRSKESLQKAKVTWVFPIIQPFKFFFLFLRWLP